MKQSDLKRYVGLKNIYDYGCYFLDLLYIGKGYEELTLEEIVEYYHLFCSKDWIDKECYVKEPTAILEFLTGEKYRVMYSKYPDQAAKHVVARFYNTYTGYAHFVVSNSYGDVVWDPIENSYTVKNGIVDSYRLFFTN